MSDSNKPGEYNRDISDWVDCEIENRQRIDRIEAQREIQRSVNLAYVRENVEKAMLAGVECHPDCAVLNPATMMMLFDEIERLQGTVRTARLISQLRVDQLIDGEGDYVRAFEDGRQFERSKSLEQGAPAAWAIRVRGSDQTRFVLKCPESIHPEEETAPLFWKSGATD